MSNLRTDNVANRTGSSSVPIDVVLQGTAKAWSYLNGTGTISFFDSFNMSSATDNGTGDYTYNFSVTMPNINYCVNSSPWASGLIAWPGANNRTTTTASLRPGQVASWDGLAASAANVTDAFAALEITGDPA